MEAILHDPGTFDENDTTDLRTPMNDKEIGSKVNESKTMESKVVDDEGTILIPLVEETLQVGKREIETGKVLLTKSIIERQETVDPLLLRTEVQVHRVSINRFVDAAPPVRYEGDIMIISLLEEVLVVEKRLRVTEEVHVTQRQAEYRAPQTVTLRSEVVAEERIASEKPLD